MNESIVDYIKQLRQLSRKNFEYFDSMTESLLKSIEGGDEKNITYLTGFLKGYQSGRDDVLKKEQTISEQIVEIKEPERKDKGDVAYFYM